MDGRKECKSKSSCYDVFVISMLLHAKPHSCRLICLRIMDQATRHGVYACVRPGNEISDGHK